MKEKIKEKDVKKWKSAQWIEVIPEYVMDEIRQSVRKETSKLHEKKIKELEKEIETWKNAKNNFEDGWVFGQMTNSEYTIELENKLDDAEGYIKQLKSQLKDQRKKIINKVFEEIINNLESCKIYECQFSGKVIDSEKLEDIKEALLQAKVHNFTVKDDVEEI